MPNPKDEAQLCDDLNSALDRISVSGDSSGAPAWLGALNERLTDLDDAFSSPAAMGLVSDRDRWDSALVEPLSSPRAAQLDVPAARRMPLNGWLMAAVLAIAAFGLGLVGANRGWWSGNENRPPGVSIAAVSTSAATAVVSEMVVTPSTCTLEPLTRERYDAIVGTATPLALEVFQADLAAKTDAFGKKLDLRIVNGEAVITAGSELPPGVARDLEATLSSWIACGNAGNEPALAGIMSDDYIRMINDPDTWFAEIEVTQEVIPTQLTEMKFEQVRLLADGSVVAVVMDILPPSDGIASEPEEMPTGTGAIQGMIYSFVPTSKGWRLDFAQSGYVLPIEIEAISATPAPDVEYVEELMVTPSTCIEEPLTGDDMSRIFGTSTPITQEEFDSLLIAKTNELVPELKLKVIDNSVTITGGSAVPDATAREVRQVLSSFLTCGSAGNLAAAYRLFSDDLLKNVLDRDQLLAQIETAASPESWELHELRIGQMRLLPNGKIVLVWSPLKELDTSASQGTPELTPQRTIAIDGLLMVLVDTPEGWRVDFQRAGDYFQVPIRDAPSSSATPTDEFVDEMVVTPSACTFEPLTREEFDQIVGTATPITDEDFDNLQVAMTNELLLALDLRVVDGSVSITAGSAVPKETADEVASVLASYMACGNSGNLPAAFRMLSDDFLARVPDQDQFLADLESPSTPEVTPPSELQVSQLRLLPDGRIALVLTFVAPLSAEYEFSPEPTPNGTVALDGVLMVFVKSSDGWRLDFQRGGENFRFQVNDEKVPPGGTAVPGDELVVTPSACTLEPMTLERYDAIVGSATPLSAQEDYDRLLDAKVDELLPALELKLIKGDVVITGGNAVSEETRAEVGELLSRFIACGNEGDFLARIGFFSDSFVKAISREAILEMLSGTPIAVGTILSDMRFQQVRLLDDGRLVMVWTNSPSIDTQNGTGLPLSTPEGTVALDGEVTVFVMTPDGWRFEFGQSGDHFRLPVKEEVSSPVGTPSAVDEMVATPAV